jgi:predicted nucleotidyltransferase component of viral defense system
MIEWLKLTDERKRQVLNQANNEIGLLPHSIEKDWWVTLALKAIFLTKWKDNLVFKGGTSLSKAWGLIQRFSEDIDLAMDRQVLGFPEEFVSKTQVTKLRKETSVFIATEFRQELENRLLALGVPADQFKLSVEESDVEDRDPQVLELGYHSALVPDAYIAERVLIEIGARSLREPSSNRDIKTILYEAFPDQSFAGEPFWIPTVDPKRTFLEKAFLLHEEFSKPIEKIRHYRLSRHLYDLERLMDTEHATAAMEDKAFYAVIIEHRQHFNAIRGLDYSFHAPAHIMFIPPDEVIGQWEADYATMRRVMIYGSSHEFPVLMQRMLELLNRFRYKHIPQHVLVRMKELKIDHSTLVRLIMDAKRTELPENAKQEGSMVTIPVNRAAFTYFLNFGRIDGELVFESLG